MDQHQHVDFSHLFPQLDTFYYVMTNGAARCQQRVFKFLLYCIPTSKHLLGSFLFFRSSFKSICCWFIFVSLQVILYVWLDPGTAFDRTTTCDDWVQQSLSLIHVCATLVIRAAASGALANKTNGREVGKQGRVFQHDADFCSVCS